MKVRGFLPALPALVLLFFFFLFPVVRMLGFSIEGGTLEDRKSTRLNSSHPSISYAVFCLKKKKLEHDRAGPAAERRAALLDNLPGVPPGEPRPGGRQRRVVVAGVELHQPHQPDVAPVDAL